MIEQAIYDYKVLTQAGVICGSKVVPGSLTGRYKFLGGYSTETSVRGLLEFLSPQTRWLEKLLAGIDSNICAVRTRQAIGWFTEEQ